MTTPRSRLRLDMAVTALVTPVFLAVAVLTHDRVYLIAAGFAVAAFAMSAAAYRSVRRREGTRR